jgi:hypothetical protein
MRTLPFDQCRTPSENAVLEYLRYRYALFASRGRFSRIQADETKGIPIVGCASRTDAPWISRGFPGRAWCAMRTLPFDQYRTPSENAVLEYLRYRYALFASRGRLSRIQADETKGIPIVGCASRTDAPGISRGFPGRAWCAMRTLPFDQCRTPSENAETASPEFKLMKLNLSPLGST